MRIAKKTNPYKYSLTTRLKEADILDMLKPAAEDKILDLGCGSGYFSDVFYSRGIPAFNVDISYDSLLMAKESAPAKYVQASAQEIPFKDSSFDKVLFTDIIEHLEDDESSLREIARVTRNQGKVVITTVCLEGVFAGSKLNLLFHDKPGSPEYHVRPGYRSEDLLTLMKAHNIIPCEVRYSTVFFGELFIELLKLFYSFIKKDFHSQADVRESGNSLLFKIYKTLFFPVMMVVSIAENKLLSRFLKGHVIIVKGKVKK